MKIDDKFIFPEINKFRNNLINWTQNYFWFLPTDEIIHTELCDIVYDKKNEEGKYEIQNINNHVPYEYISDNHKDAEEDIERYNMWGITNNNENNYCELKVDKNGIFYTQSKNILNYYKFSIEYTENDETIYCDLYKNNENFKFSHLCLYKYGHFDITGPARTGPMTLDKFIVGFYSIVSINDELKLHIDITATIPNELKFSYPTFSVNISAKSQDSNSIEKSNIQDKCNTINTGILKLESDLEYKENIIQLKDIALNTTKEFIFSYE